MFCNDALKIVLARELEQCFAVAFNVLAIQQTLGFALHNGAEPELALTERSWQDRQLSIGSHKDRKRRAVRGWWSRRGAESYAGREVRGSTEGSQLSTHFEPGKAR